MKKTLLLPLLLFSTLFVQAQKPLTNSRTSSVYTYIYRLDDAATLLFLAGKQDLIKDEELKNEAAKYLTDKPQKVALSPGNYLKVTAVKNQLKYNLIQKHNASLILLANGTDVRFILLDDNSNEITTAQVYHQNKITVFDPQAETYHSRRAKKDTLFKVVYNGVSNFFNINEAWYRPYRRYYEPQNSKKGLAKFWQKITSPITKLLSNSKLDERSRFRQATPTNPGFIVFNKPKYRPGDTVKFKAFILQKKSKLPVNDKQLIVRLKDDKNDNGKIIGYVNAYRKGGFEYQFKLNDSLKISLDDDYLISLETLDSKTYDADTYKGKKEDWEVVQLRTVYQEGKFRFEDYELKTNKFNVRVDRRDGSPGLPATVYFKATDDNGLNVPDGRVVITLNTEQATFHGDDKHVFVPDLLLQHQVILDPVGETKFIIPDSIFPKAKIRYTAKFELLNSNNESIKKTEMLDWDFNDKVIDTKIEHDTLKINYLIAGKNRAVEAELTPLSTNIDTVPAVSIKLPANVHIGAGRTGYMIKAAGLSKTVFIRSYESELQTTSYRSVDSLFITAANPNNIKFWYTIYTDNKVFDQGTATQLNYKKPLKYGGRVTLLTNYFWGGIPLNNEQMVPYLDKYLNISVNQPVSVYPGQQAEVEVNVKTIAGKAVANADITAYSITRKFENYQPTAIPYLGKSFKTRAVKPLLDIMRMNEAAGVKLNWQHWATGMGLDTINYYRFTHPDTTFSITEPAPGNVTQVAPFIVMNGDIIPVHILYIDERPVYFSQSQDLQRYSFPVDTGKHSLFFRTINESIRLNNVKVPLGKKLILSINADPLQNKKLIHTTMPDSLVNYEADLVNKYMVSIVPNFNEYMATLTQGDKTFLINHLGGRYNGYYYGQGTSILVGPFASNRINFSIKGGFNRSFVGESGYSFEFQPDLIKQKSLPFAYPFGRKLKPVTGNTDYTQYVLTPAETDTIWRDYLDKKANTAYKSYYSNQYNGRLLVTPGKLINGELPFVKNVLLYKKGDPDFLQIYPGKDTRFSYLEPGKYRLLFLLKGDSYYLMDDLTVNSGGVNYYNAGTITPLAPDSVSLKIAKITAVPNLNYIDRRSTNNIKEAFNEKYLDMSAYKDEMLGYVYDAKTGEPLTGTTIGMNGKGITQADINGYFRVKVPASGNLVFTNVGYGTQEVKIQSGHIIIVKMTTDGRSLNDVVIRGYVKQSRDETTGSSYIVTPNGQLRQLAEVNINTELMGKVAGLNIQNNTGASGMRGTVILRELSTRPMYVIDGVKINGKDFVMPADDMIASRSILTADAAVAIYGPEAANGAVIIVTKKAANEQPAQTLRRNFSDYAYWLPHLKTDANGQLKFKVTYPDDITSWRTFVIGVTDNRQSGFVEGQVKSFKPVSANFVSPLFAVKGDNFAVLGKALNYTTDTLTLNRKFSYNGKTVADGNITLRNAVIDTFKLVAAGADSLNFEYAIKRSTGYFDGERRTIPLFEQGSLETKGSFDVLEKDTTLTLQMSPGLKEATLRAEASVFPALLDEAQHLRDYEYLCNEQLASKLKGLLAEKQIREYLRQPFKGDKDIKDIIKKLTESRNQEGTWGWWKGTEEELWITSHVMEALIAAESKGFATGIDKQRLSNYLVLRLDFYTGPDRLTDIALLKAINPNINLRTYVTNYENSVSPKTKQSDLDRYKLMYTRQLVDMPVVIDSLLKDMKRTMFGNVYWGAKSYSFFNSSIQQSLLAYHILKAEGKHAALLAKLRNYFLEQRASGYWRNTYESAEILETILPDMMLNGQQPKPAALKITGGKTETVTQFPYTTTLSAGAKVTVSKTGDMPVYLTAYQNFWNPAPAKVSGDFTVNTWFSKDENPITKIKGGQAINLTAEVIVKADADYVMVEIPIPAGCSYDSKDQGYYGGEVHREYFKNKVSIFCRKLTVGTYKYVIKLMPRYSGNYHLNPAKAEMMYFPVFYGREGMKMFEIGD